MKKPEQHTCLRKLLTAFSLSWGLNNNFLGPQPNTHLWGPLVRAATGTGLRQGIGLLAWEEVPGNGPLSQRTDKQRPRDIKVYRGQEMACRSGGSGSRGSKCDRGKDILGRDLRCAKESDFILKVDRRIS